MIGCGRPSDDGAALINPDMGWTMHFYSNIPKNYGSRLEPSDTLEEFPRALDRLPPCSLGLPGAPGKPVQLAAPRYPGAALDLAGEEGRLADHLLGELDEVCNPGVGQEGRCQGVFYELGKGRRGPTTGHPGIPDFGDPVFLRKLDHFLEVLAARYDGNPNIAFVDIGSYGLWGEGHTLMSSRVAKDRAREMIQQHLDLHLKHFKHTLLAFNDDMAGPEQPGSRLPETDMALARGLALRTTASWFSGPPVPGITPSWLGNSGRACR